MGCRGSGSRVRDPAAKLPNPQVYEGVTNWEQTILILVQFLKANYLEKSVRRSMKFACKPRFQTHSPQKPSRFPHLLEGKRRDLQSPQLEGGQVVCTLYFGAFEGTP